MRLNKNYLILIGILVSITSGIVASYYLSSTQSAVIFCIVLMLFFWTTESIALPITALLPVFIFSAAGMSSVSEVLTNYAHPVIYLFFGGFLLAIGLQKWKIDVWFSRLILNTIGNTPERILAGFIISTALLSMWISNTATAVMMLPLAKSILANEDRKPIFTKLLYLSIAFSANIGGMATLIGTPPNIVLAALYEDRYGTAIGFATWLQFGLPISIILLLMMYGLFIVRLRKSGESNELTIPFSEKNESLNTPQKRFLTIFALTAGLWIFKPIIKDFFQLDFLDDTFIALLGGALLFIIPQGIKSGRTLLSWKHTRSLPWGILLIFGGGLSLAMGIESSGLGLLLGESLKIFSHWHLILLMLLISFFGLMATELMSNVALVSVFIPIVFLLGDGMGLDPFALSIPLTLAASCAFMLPIATPPNMVVYASGKVSFSEMASIGWKLNLFSLISIVLFWYFLGGLFY
jgi:solute carrier family 13 (sodium-dependent dicarboxylate transporter), member 2/3/5